MRVPVRTITFGVASPHPLGRAELERASEVLKAAGEAFGGQGYEVQTLRLSTRPVLADLAGWKRESVVAYAHELQGALDAVGVGFCSLGPAMPADGPDAPAVLAEALAGNLALNGSVVVAISGSAVRPDAALGAARAMLFLARETEQGLGNFNFAALGCVGPGAPFFPAAYHAGPASLSVGLQGASAVAGALAGGAELGQVEGLVRAKLREVAGPVAQLAQEVSGEVGAAFGGVDLSPAPDGGDSIAAAMEMADGQPLGAPGTLALAAAVTAGVRSTGLPSCGYCGLMLPVMEDAVLARRWEEGRLGLDQLLAWSAVCGTGLDTVPVPGDTAPEVLARVICDMGSLAGRLGKPLSARLLPVPGKRAGERTEFSSPYLVNTLIKNL